MTKIPILTVAALAIAAPGAASAHDDGLPLGDGRVSDAPAAGYVFQCPFKIDFPDQASPNNWIKDGRWYPSLKPSVQGSNAWPDARIEIKREGDRRLIVANNLPLHATGNFPIQPSDPAYQFDTNTNKVEVQTVLYDLPASPTLAAQPTCVNMGPVAFAVTGAGIYNAIDLFKRDAPAHEVQDACGGHPDPLSRYHYHNFTACMPDADGEAGRHSALIGYVLDGFGIYGPVGETGEAVTNADLDACHGHSHEIEWNGERVSMYHYHFTAEFPYTVGCFAGTPVGISGDGSEGLAPAGGATPQ